MNETEIKKDFTTSFLGFFRSLLPVFYKDAKEFARATGLTFVKPEKLVPGIPLWHTYEATTNIRFRANQDQPIDTVRSLFYYDVVKALVHQGWKRWYNKSNFQGYTKEHPDFFIGAEIKGQKATIFVEKIKTIKVADGWKGGGIHVFTLDCFREYLLRDQRLGNAITDMLIDRNENYLRKLAQAIIQMDQKYKVV